MIFLIASLLIGAPATMRVDDGTLIFESVRYVPVYDTSVNGGGDFFHIAISERNRYVCAEKESVTTMVSKAWFIQDRDSSQIEPSGLYNLDAPYKNIQYIRRRSIGGKQFLFARLGPESCPYYVAWVKEGRIYRRKDLFEPPIAFDPYQDEVYLQTWLKTLIR